MGTLTKNKASFETLTLIFLLELSGQVSLHKSCFSCHHSKKKKKKNTQRSINTVTTNINIDLHIYSNFFSCKSVRKLLSFETSIASTMKINSPNSTIWYKQWQNKFKIFNKNKKLKREIPVPPSPTMTSLKLGYSTVCWFGRA